MFAKTVFLGAVTFIFAVDLSPERTFQCRNDGGCQALLPGDQSGLSFEHCHLICDPDGNLWPKVRSFSRRSTTTVFVDIPGTVQQLNFSSPNPPLLNRIVEVFRQNLLNYFSWKPANVNGKPLNIIIGNPFSPDVTKISLNVNESYTISISCRGDSATATLSADTVFGIRHALETLTQLIIYDDVQRGVRVACDVDIQDSPAFPYRGIAMDTAAHWFPTATLKALIDGMAMNKLNRFHWHMTDSETFPIEMRKWPNLTYYGAYNPRTIYRQEDVHDLVEYALVRGIQVIPELDVPSHVGHGFDLEWTVPAGLGRVVLCFARPFTTAPNGYINPTNPKSYEILNDIYSELFDITDQPDLIHIGASEASLDCWLNDSEVQQWLNASNYTQNIMGGVQLWSDFEAKMQNIVKNISKNSAIPILWSNTLTNVYPELLKEKLGTDNIAIQVWQTSDTSTVPDLLGYGFKVIVSNSDAWYLDCGFGNWDSEGNTWCSPYKYWQLIYDNRPYKSLFGDWKITDPEKRKLILGGEVGAWSEIIDVGSLGAKVWPRAAAIAERLWSDPAHCWYFANARMQFHRYRMTDRGIQADAIQPYWCDMYEGLCLVDPSTYSQTGRNTTCDEFLVPTTKAPSTTSTSSTGTFCGFENRIGWTFLVSIVLYMLYVQFYFALQL